MNTKLKQLILVIIFFLLLFQNGVLGKEILTDGGPTLDDEYIIDLTALLLFYVILIVLLVISKLLMKKEEKNQKETYKTISKKFITFIFTISIMYFLLILFNKESYAVIATSRFYLGFYEIMLVCFGIFFTNCIITLVFNKVITIKQFFCQNIINTIYESIILSIVGIIHYSINSHYIIILLGLPIGYKTLRICLKQKNNKSGLQKLLTILIYTICLFIICIKVQPKYIRNYSKSGTVITRKITEYGNNGNRYYDTTNIETFVDGKLVKSNQIRKVEGN